MILGGRIKIYPCLIFTRRIIHFVLSKRKVLQHFNFLNFRVLTYILYVWNCHDQTTLTMCYYNIASKCRSGLVWKFVKLWNAKETCLILSLKIYSFNCCKYSIITNTKIKIKFFIRTNTVLNARGSACLKDECFI